MIFHHPGQPFQFLRHRGEQFGQLLQRGFGYFRAGLGNPRQAVDIVQRFTGGDVGHFSSSLSLRVNSLIFPKQNKAIARNAARNSHPCRTQYTSPNMAKPTEAPKSNVWTIFLTIFPFIYHIPVTFKSKMCLGHPVRHAIFQWYCIPSRCCPTQRNTRCRNAGSYPRLTMIEILVKFRDEDISEVNH